MPSNIEYAQLSGSVYTRKQNNRTPLPTGWSSVQTVPDRLTGFSAGVFQKGNDIVIAYTGTNEKQVKDFLTGNVPAAVGLPTPQVIEAMGIYLQTKKDNPNANITFTGHSLGGGLASLMAVYFDKPATIFDPAPFKASATNPITLAYYGTGIAALGLSDATFSTYIAAIATPLVGAITLSARQARVTSIEVEGEILALTRSSANTIYGGERDKISVGNPTMLDTLSPSAQAAARTNLHSITLLSTLLQSANFKSAIEALPNALGLFFDQKLYATDPQSSDIPNFLDKLLIQEVSGPATGITLDRFAADLQKLTGTQGAAQSTPAVRDALTVAAMEYYYVKDIHVTPGVRVKLFSADSNLI